LLGSSQEDQTVVRTEREAEQEKHSGKFLYHLTKSHPTSECYIKKECEKLLAAKRSNDSNSSSTSNSITTGHLRNLKEDLDKEHIVDKEALIDTLPECNDTNKDDLIYFSHIKNHY
jgi:hypothetical protein